MGRNIIENKGSIIFLFLTAFNKEITTCKAKSIFRKVNPKFIIYKNIYFHLLYLIIGGGKIWTLAENYHLQETELLRYIFGY